MRDADFDDLARRLDASDDAIRRETDAKCPWIGCTGRRDGDAKYNAARRARYAADRERVRIAPPTRAGE